jgi:hypothetical protein
MKNVFTLFSLATIVIFTSCTSVYKNTQMPDDLYYAPTAPKVEREEEKTEEQKEQEREDRFIKQKVQNRVRWNTIDDYTYWNDTRYNHCNCNCNGNVHWNSYNTAWTNTYNNWLWFNNFNNPYTLFVPYTAPNTVKNTSSFTPVRAYGNNNTSNTNFVFNPKLQALQGNNNSNNTSNKTPTQGIGGKIIRLFGGGNSNTTPSSSAGGQSGGFKSTGTSTSTPRKGRG